LNPFPAIAMVELAGTDPNRCAILCANLGGDTDTIGAMATAICGAGACAIDPALKMSSMPSTSSTLAATPRTALPGAKGGRMNQICNVPTLGNQRPVTVLGAAVIDVIADAYALPWRGCDIELKQQGVNIGGCALNIAIALKRLGITAQNACPSATCGRILSATRWRRDLHSAVEAKPATTAGVWRW
jgi:hypothetical protein